MSNELKPCPKCHKNPLTVINPIQGANKVTIKCMSCGESTRTMTCYEGWLPFKESINLAEAALAVEWNNK